MNEKRVLVVDDEVDLTYTFRVILESEGFKVDTFNDPLLVLSSFKPNCYDLGLLDIIMPNMDGFCLNNELKKQDNKIKILFMTASDAYYSQCQREIYSQTDKDSFLHKPIENRELVKRINTTLEIG